MKLVTLARALLCLLSASLTVQIGLAASSVPLAPSNLKATATGAQVQLTWQDNSSNEQGFWIEGRSSNATSYQRLQSVSINIASVVLPLPSVRPYYYRVAAFSKVRGKTVGSTYATVTLDAVVIEPTPTPTPSPTPLSSPIPPKPPGTVGPTISTFKPSGPIVLVSGQTVTGLSISNPNGPCIYGNGVSNVRIYNNKIGPCGPDTNHAAVQITSGQNITIEHNAIDDVVAGFFANTSSNNLVFDHNYVTRIKNAYPRAQMVQIAQTNGSGIRITCNISDQPTPGYLGGPEDHINIYRSNGTPTSPILIKNNKIRGGGPSPSGGGILASDDGSSYVTAESNILVNPGQYGISIAGGHDNKLLNNKVYSSSFSWTNVGAFVWNQYAPACYGNEVSGNRVNWINRDGQQNAWWNGNNCGPIIMNGNVFPDLSIGPEIWNEVFPDCE